MAISSEGKNSIIKDKMLEYSFINLDSVKNSMSALNPQDEVVLISGNKQGDTETYIFFKTNKHQTLSDALFGIEISTIGRKSADQKILANVCIEDVGRKFCFDGSEIINHEPKADALKRISNLVNIVAMYKDENLNAEDTKILNIILHNSFVVLGKAVVDKYAESGHTKEKILDVIDDLNELRISELLEKYSPVLKHNLCDEISK